MERNKRVLFSRDGSLQMSLKSIQNWGKKHTNICFYHDTKWRSKSVTLLLKKVTRGTQMDCNYRCHIPGDPSTLRDPRARKMTQIGMSGFGPCKLADLKAFGDTACHKLFILLGNVLKCWTFRHDLKIRLDVTRALETPQMENL